MTRWQCSICKANFETLEEMGNHLCSDNIEKVHSAEFDEINKSKHYNSHPSGVECITIAQHETFNLGNVYKYIWRHGLKSEDKLQDLKKAKYYLDKEIERLETQLTEK